MDEKLPAGEGAQVQQRNSPSTAGPSNAFPPAWQIYDNPLFCDEGARGYLKAELEKERRLREKAEALRESAARDAAEERRKREAAETKLKEVEAEMVKRGHDETIRLNSATASAEAPEKTATGAKDDVGLREQSQCRYQRQQRGGGGADQRRGCVQEKMTRKEVENPHIRRGIVGFVEFPGMMRNRTRGGGRTVGPTGKREGKAGGETVPSLECQKAQLRVLLKNNRVSPVASNFSARSGG